MEIYYPLIARLKMTMLIVGLVWSLAYAAVAVEKKNKMMVIEDVVVEASYENHLYNKRISNDSQHKSDMYKKQRSKPVFHVH